MPRTRTPLLVAGVLVGVLAVGYGVTVLGGSDDIPAGVRVASVDIGGRSAAQAARLLASGLTDAATRPVTLLVQGRSATLEPATAGLSLDVGATVRRAREGGAWARLAGLLGRHRTVAPQSRVDLPMLRAALTQVARGVDAPPVPAGVRYRGLVPYVTPGRPGQALDVAASAEAVRRRYLHGAEPVVLPLRALPAPGSPADLSAVLAGQARTAVAAPVTLVLPTAALRISPDDLAATLSFVALPGGGAQPVLDGTALRLRLAGQLRPLEVAPVDATFDVAHGTPVVVPGRAGRTVTAEALRQAVLPLLAAAPGARSGAVALEDTPPRVTTELAGTLGIREVIGTFTTYHPCCRPRVQNIHTIASLVNGYVLRPGDIFSLNGVVGQRDSGRGFVEAPQILDGQFVSAVGGGVSQFATTIFNAVFFAGLKDVQHMPHSYYISRYPAGRESTVSFPQPDFQFQDDAPTGVLITTSFTGTSVTVTFWGTKRFDIESVSGPRTRITAFHVEYVTRADCTPSAGGEGFDIDVYRVFRRAGVELRREKFHTRYLPEPRFVCGSAPAPRSSSPSSQPSPTAGPASPAPSPRPSG